MVYNTNARFIIAHVLSPKQLDNEILVDRCINFINDYGFKEFMKSNNKSIPALCDYFTKMTGSIKPITTIQVTM